MKRSTRKRLGAGILFLGLVLLFAGIPAYRVFFKPVKAEVQIPLSPVLVESARRGRMSDSLFFPGILTPQSTVAVVSKLSAKVERLLVKEGDKLEIGSLVAVLDDEIPRLQAVQAKAALEAATAQRAKAVRGVRPQELESAKASLAQAQKDLDAAKKDFDRTEKLYKSGGVSKAKFEEAENAIRKAEVQVENAGRQVKLMEEGASTEDLAMAGANVNAMRAQYDLAAVQLRNAEVRSPVAGVVAKTMVKAGNMVGLGSPIVAVVQDGSVVAQIALPEKLYGRVTGAPNGVKVVVKPIAYQGQRAFEGLLTSISETVDAASRTFTAEAAIRNPERLLKPGMYVNAELILSTLEDAVLVPSAAVVKRGGERGVFVLRGDGEKRAIFLPVRVGLERDGLIALTEGISEGELVVTEGNAFLESGQAVRVVDAQGSQAGLSVAASPVPAPESTSPAAAAPGVSAPSLGSGSGAAAAGPESASAAAPQSGTSIPPPAMIAPSGQRPESSGVKP